MAYFYDPNTPQGQNPPQDFTGSVESLGYGEMFQGTQWEDTWQQYFDPYDPRREELSTRMTDIDLGQLQSAWDLQSTQLGESWDLTQQQLGQNLGSQRGQIGTGHRQQISNLGGGWEAQQAGFGTQAARGFQQADLMGETMQRRGKGLMHGEQRQRMAESEVSGAYKRSFGLGQSAYERAMEGATDQYRQGLDIAQLGYEQGMGRGELAYGQAMQTGELGLEQNITDLYQGLEQDVFGIRESWQQGQRGTLNMLLGQATWADSGGGQGYGDVGDSDGPGNFNVDPSIVWPTSPEQWETFDWPGLYPGDPSAGSYQWDGSQWKPSQSGQAQVPGSSGGTVTSPPVDTGRTYG